MSAIRKHLNEKAQGLVEYVLIIAFIAGVAFAMFGGNGGLKGTLASAVNSITGVIESINGGFDMPTVIASITGKDGVQGIQEHYTSGNYGSHDKNYKRGFIMSSWLTEDDKNNSEIQSIADELGAVAWVYYNGIIPPYNNVNLTTDAQGLYWHTDSMQGYTFTKKSDENCSNEKVLSYFYNQNTGKYEVIKNYVWLDQNNNGEYGLTAITKEWKKPAGESIGSYDTYQEAQAAYAQAKADNGGSIVFN